MSITKFGRRAVANGFRIVPVAGRQKFPAIWSEGKWKAMKDWGRYAHRQPTDIEFKIWAGWPDCSVGIVTGNVVAVDLDILDPEVAPLARAIVVEALGETLERVGQAPKRLLLYRTEKPFLGFRARPLPVEILCLGQQFVADGTHPLGHSYAWLGDSPSDTDISTLPVVTEAQVRACMDRLLNELPKSVRIAGPDNAGTLKPDADSVAATTSALGPTARFEAVEAAMSWIPNPDAHYDTWVKIGLALKAAVGRDGAKLFEEWSAQSSKNDPETTAKTWAKLKPNGKIGAGSLFSMAMASGWVPEPDMPFNDDPTEGVVIDLPAMREAKARREAESTAAAPKVRDTVDDDRYIYASTGSAKLDALIDKIIANATPMLRQIAAYHAACLSGAPVPIFSMGTAIMAISVAMSRTHLSPTDSTPSVGQVQIAESGGGKEAAMDAIRRMFGAAGMDMFLGSGSPQSEGAVLKDLKRHPVLVYGIDEFGDFMRRHDNTKNQYGIGAIIKTLVGSSNKKRWNGASYAGDRDEIIIESPALSILGTTTEDQLFTALSAGTSKDGFLPRFLFLPFQHPPKEVEFRLTPIPDPDPAITAFLRSIARMGTIPGNLAKDTPHDYSLPPAPETYFTWGPGGREAYLDIKRKESAKLSIAPDAGHQDIAGLRSLENRRAQRAQQFAMVRAISAGRTDITAADMEWGSDLWSLGIGTFLRGNAKASDMSMWGVSIQKMLEAVRTVAGENAAFIAGKGRDIHKLGKEGHGTVAEKLARAVAPLGWVSNSALRNAYKGQAEFKKVMVHCVEANLIEEIGGGMGKQQILDTFGDLMDGSELAKITKPPKLYRLLG
jgi:hypothetical protein